MAGHNYINPNNLFEDDEFDNKSGSSYRNRNPPVSRPKTAATSYGGYIGDLERQRQMKLERQREIEQRTLDSSARSVKLLRDSETLGIATAKELARQGEALDNTNHHLDKITADLTSTQNSINGIKSVFHDLKNYVSGKSHQRRCQYLLDTQNIGPNSSSLNDALYTLEKVRKGNDNFDSQPSTSFRGVNEQAMALPVDESQRVNEMLDNNLDEMDQAITRLKGLGIALGHEIDQQNHLLDTITVKVDDAVYKIGSQTKQMHKLL